LKSSPHQTEKTIVRLSRTGHVGPSAKFYVVENGGQHKKRSGRGYKPRPACEGHLDKELRLCLKLLCYQ